MLAIISNLSNSFLYFFVLFNKPVKVIVLNALSKHFRQFEKNEIKKVWIKRGSYGRREAL